MDCGYLLLKKQMGGGMCVLYVTTMGTQDLKGAIESICTLVFHNVPAVQLISFAGAETGMATERFDQSSFPRKLSRRARALAA